MMGEGRDWGMRCKLRTERIEEEEGNGEEPEKQRKNRIEQDHEATVTMTRHQSRKRNN